MKKRKVIVFDPVYHELNQVVSYYESKAQGLGLRFYEAFDKALKAIATNAEGYEKKYKNNLQIGLKKFPFVLIFDVRETIVLVNKLTHTRRHHAKRYTRKGK